MDTVPAQPDLALALRLLCDVIKRDASAKALTDAAAALIPGTEGVVLVEPAKRPPIYLHDSFIDEGAHGAVLQYCKGTHIVNPVWNAIQAGLGPGIYRVAELAPEQRSLPVVNVGVHIDDEEEIGFRTPGWPPGRAEVSMLTALPGNLTGEMSLLRPVEEGGFSEAMIALLSDFKPLFDLAFTSLWPRHSGSLHNNQALVRLDDFGREFLSPREALIAQMILKGHSNVSIGLILKINTTTVKTHRKNAYAKLGISTQQELFNAFLVWLDTSPINEEGGNNAASTGSSP